ncbi:MAG TPA: hypothetical protein VIW24_24280 [Aldersonia sp.]
MSPVLARGRRLVEWWRGLGIRNSTILLCVAWLAIFVLYVYVRPEPQPSTAVTPVPAVTTTPAYVPTYDERTRTGTTTPTTPTTPTSPTGTEPGQLGGTDTSAPTTTTGLLDNLIPPFLRPETTSSAPN